MLTQDVAFISALESIWELSDEHPDFLTRSSLVCYQSSQFCDEHHQQLTCVAKSR